MAGIRASTFYSKKSSDTRICFPSNGAISEDDDNDDLSDDSDRGETRFSRSLFLSDKVIPPSEPESSEEEIYSAPTKKCSKPMKKISAGQIVDRYANFSNHQSSKANGRAVLATKNPRTRHGVGACSQHYPATLQKKNDIRQETDLTSNRKFDLTKAAADNPRARLGFGSNGQNQSTTLEKKHRSKPGKDSMSDIDSDEAGLLDASISSPEIPFYPSILNSSSDDDTLDAETVASTCKKPARRLVFKSSDESQSTLAKPLVPQSLLDSTPPTCPFNARRKLTEGLSVKPVSETIKATCDEAQQPQSTATITNQVLQENNSCGINSVDAAVKANSAGLQSKRETIQEKDTARPVLQVLNQNRPEAMKSPVNSSPAKHLRRTRNFEKKSSVMSAVCHRHPRKISSVKVNPQQCRLPKNSQTKTFSSLDNRKDEHLPADGDIELCDLGNDKPTQSSEVTQKQLKPQGESATKSLLPPALDSQKENHLPVGGDVNWTDVDLCGFGNDIVPPVQSSAVNPKKPKLQTTRKAEVLNQNRPEALKSPMNSPPAKRSRQTRNSKQNLTTIDALSHTKKTTSDVTQKQLQPQGKSLTKTRSSLDLENEKDNLLPVGGDVSWTDVDICGFGNDIIPPTESSAVPEAADAVVLCTPKSPPTTERSNQRTHLGRSSKNKKPVNYRENVDDSNDVTADPDFEPEIETVIEVENDAKKSKPSNKKKKVTAVQTKSCAKKPRTKKRFAQEMALLGEDELALGEDNSQWRDDDLPGTNIRLAVDAIDNCDRLQRPVEYFRHFIDDDVCELIVNRSNLYHMQKNGKQLNLSVDELKQFLGVWIYIGVCNLPSLRDYWHTETRVPQVANVMSFNRYQKIKASIHIADNSELEELADDPDDPGAATETQAIKNKDDRLFKIRPLMEIIKAKLKALPQENYFSIDETMIPYKGVFAGKLRQYVKGKPHKFGFKNFTLAGVSGIVYDFNMYTGKTTFDHCNLSEDVKKLGIGAMAVISLCNTIKSPETSMVFFDNWFTGFPLLAYLRDKMNILSTGTIRQNRTERCPMPSDREIIKAGRGTSVVKVNNYGVACVNWADNKVVRLASTAVGVQPETKVRRYCNESKAKREIPCPQIIELYNKNMGGVDKHDMMVEINRLPTRSKRWYLPIIGYLLDLSLVNSYLIYQRQAKQLELKPDFTTSKDFRLEVSKSLRTVEKQKGRPPSSGGAKKKDLISSPRYRVADEVRFDGLHHMPSYKKKQGRCKNCKKGKTFVVCAKCDANLCFTRPQNCFAQFHTNTATAAA